MFLITFLITGASQSTSPYRGNKIVIYNVLVHEWTKIIVLNFEKKIFDCPAGTFH